MSNLTIYKASAGSGKTYQLTGEYLKLIFSPKTSFSSILAVTFTNKATAEMRERILQELFLLANSNNSSHSENLKSEFGFTDEDLKRKAAFLLKQILHNYSKFNISTIDSFFQNILKAFTRELGLNVGFSIELNISKIIELTVDNLFNDIQDKKDLMHWLTNYSFQEIEQGKRWDIQRNVFEFTKKAFSELFFSFTDEEVNSFSDIDNLNNYKKELNKIVNKFTEQAKDVGIQTEQILTRNGLTVDDFSYKNSGVVGLMLKHKYLLPQEYAGFGARAQKAYETNDFISGWIPKGLKENEKIKQCVENELHPQLSRLFQIYDSDFKDLNTANIILKNIDNLALVVEVFNFLSTYCNEKNIFLLPLASPLLANIIGSDDAPFIYEKTGAYLKHFMIDEFQDTSQLQWKNFAPLFQNSLSQNQKSLVVGDVKQSIYRWRNSDWQLLEFEIQKQFEAFKPKEVVLPNNWRSNKNIVLFNNWFFKNAAELAQNSYNLIFENQEPTKLITKIFSTVEQHIPNNNLNTKGFVEVCFYQDVKNNEETNLAATEYTINSLLELFEKNYQPKDIAILVRENKQGAAIAQSLMDYRVQNPEKAHLFNFVSNDSVFLESSNIIQLLIAFLEYLNDEKNLLTRGKVLYFLKKQKGNLQGVPESLVDVDLSDDESFFSHLPREMKKVLQHLKELSISKIIAELLQCILTGDIAEYESQIPFITCFQDIVLKFSQETSTNISSFLEWWEEFGKQTPITLSDEQNAIRIVTIHKSKGLEYDAVILPFANWKLDQKSTLLWSKVAESPFNQLPRIPIMYSSGLLNSYFEPHYQKEKLLASIDALNTLYVAFTRAKKSLFLGMPYKDITKKVSLVSNIIQTLVEKQAQELHIPFEQDEFLYRFGSLEKAESKGAENVSKIRTFINPFGLKKENVKIKPQTPCLNDVQAELLNEGSVLHSILENVIMPNDVENSVKKAVSSGVISTNDSTKYTKLLSNKIALPDFSDWFSNKWEVLNERSLIDEKGRHNIPDRVLFSESEIVVVDYKFTLQESDKHKLQVRRYVRLIELVEDKKVTGFVWYVFLDKKVQV